MASERRDRLPLLIPLLAMGVLAAAFVGTTLAKLNAPQGNKPTAAATSSPSPAVATAPEPKKATPASPPTEQAAPTRWMKVKESPTGCHVGFDIPTGDRQKVACFFSGQVFATAGEQQNGFTPLSTGESTFWMESRFLEPAQPPNQAPAMLLPPQPQSNWN